jgi:glycosyltransferase involved in cell wall biosynthesis
VIVNGGNCQWADVNWVHYVHAAYTPSVSGPIPRRLKAKVAHKTFLARESRAIHQATVVIANSERTRRDVIELLGVSEDRVHTVYYGIDPDIFKPATTHTKLAIRTKLNWEPERPVVAFVGALGDRRKGFDILFDAWLALCNDPSWDTDLAVIGAGSELAAWRDRAAAAKIDKRIRFLGFRNDVPMILQACDALASPTRYEAYGLAVHEALCCGLPAFVPASAGVAELYSENLRTWTIRNVESSAEWIDRLRAWRSNLAGARAAVAPFASSLRARDWNVMSEAIVRRMG